MERESNSPKQSCSLLPYRSDFHPFATPHHRGLPNSYGVACYNVSTACSTRPTNDSVDKYACRFTGYKTCHSVCAEPIQCFAPKLSASLEPYLIFYKELTLALLVRWLGENLSWYYRVLQVRIVPIASCLFRTALARTMCYVVIHKCRV